MIDKELFKENFSFFDKEVVLEIIDIFINEYPDRMQTLELDIKNSDSESIKFNAHSIKGVIANFIDEESKELAKELEYKGRNNDNEGTEEIFQNLKISGDKLIEDLKELRKNYM